MLSPGKLANVEISDQKLEAYVEWIEDWMEVSAENGLFNKRQTDSANITTNLLLARESLTSSRAKVKHYIFMVMTIYSNVLQFTSRKWKFLNLYAGDIWVYLIGVFTIAFLIYYLNLNSGLADTLNVPLTGINAAVWGVIGGVLRGLWRLWGPVNRGTYRKLWRIYFLNCPFLGGVFGSIMYVLILAGLLVLNQTPDLTGINQSFVIIGFATLAGYNWEWAVKRFDKIGEMI